MKRAVTEQSINSLSRDWNWLWSLPEELKLGTLYHVTEEKLTSP